MKAKVEKFVKSCPECQIFSDKKTTELIQPHKVLDHCWEKVAVDLFGPMPSSHHIVVVQDLASRYPAAKVVTSTKASKVILVLADIYDNLGSPELQLSDNGPPFNSENMQTFAGHRNIQLQKIPPLHHEANPVETFMRPLGKSMKIAHHNRTQEQDALDQLLINYRNTPHPATGIPPAAMLFRDSQISQFPRHAVSDQDIANARFRDTAAKLQRQKEVNASKYRTPSQLQVGGTVLLRNYNKTSKFDPVFSPELCTIVNTDQQGRCLVLEQESDGRIFKRHSNDVKPFTSNNSQSASTTNNVETPSEQEIAQMWQQMFNDCMGGHMNDLNEPSVNSSTMPGMNPPVETGEREPTERRLQNRNPCYFNDMYEN